MFKKYNKEYAALHLISINNLFAIDFGLGIYVSVQHSQRCEKSNLVSTRKKRSRIDLNSTKFVRIINNKSGPNLKLMIKIFMHMSISYTNNSVLVTLKGHPWLFHKHRSTIYCTLTTTMMILLMGDVEQTI